MFFIFALLAVTNTFENDAVAIWCSVFAGITGIAIAYSIGFQYWEVDLVGPEPFVAVESLIDVYLGSNAFVRGFGRLQFRFGVLSIIVAVFAVAICLGLLTHRQVVQKLWKREKNTTEKLIRSIFMLVSFVLTDMADIAILGTGILSDRNCSRVNSNDVLVIIFLLSNPILAEASKISETKRMRKELNENLVDERKKQKLELSNNLNNATKIRAKYREKIRGMNAESFRALQRQTIKATAQTVITAYIIFPVLVASVYSDVFLTFQWLHLCVPGAVAFGWYLVMELLGFGYRLQWLNEEFTSILPRYLLCCWVLYLVQSKVIDPENKLCKLELLLYVYFAYLLFPLLVKIYFGSSRVEERHLALGVDKDSLENEYAWTSLQNDPVNEKISWEFSSGRDIKTFFHQWTFAKSLLAPTKQTLWFMANFYVELVASNTIITKFDGEVTLSMKNGQEKSLLTFPETFDSFLLTTDFAVIFFHLGIANYDAKFFHAAESNFQRALQIYTQIYGQNSSQVAGCYINMANIYHLKKFFDQAMQYCQRAIQIYTRIYGQDSANVAMCYHNMASVYESQTDFDQAMQYYQRALQIHTQIHGQNSSQVADCYIGMGETYRKQTEFD